MLILLFKLIGPWDISIKRNNFKLILATYGCDISRGIALRWTSLDISDDKSALVHVMVWCRQATSHYLSQCWPRSVSPYGVIRTQCVKGSMPSGFTIRLVKLSDTFVSIDMHVWLTESRIPCCAEQLDNSNLFMYGIRHPNMCKCI